MHNLTNIIWPDGNGSKLNYSKERKALAYVTKIVNPDNTASEFLYKFIIRIDKTMGVSVLKGERERRPEEIILTDNLGNKTIRNIRNNGQYIEKINAAGIKNIIKKNENYKIIEKIDENGNTTKYDRDDNGNKIKKTDPVGNVWKYTYNEFNQITSQTNPDKSVKRYKYDDKGNLLEKVNEIGASIKYTYYENGLLESEKDTLGRYTYYEYDEYSNLKKIIEPGGNIKEYVYDEIGRLIKETSSACCGGSLKEYEYNENNQVIVEKDALGNEIKYDHDVMGRRKLEIDKRGNITRYYNNLMGKMTNRTRYGSTISISKILDENGNLISETDGNGNVTKYVYDELNRVIESTNALGFVIKMKRDAAGNITNAINANGNIKRFYYDSNNRRTNIIDPLGYSEKTGYNENGRVSCIIDKNGNRTDYVYDTAGRLTKIIDAENNYEARKYDLVGNLIELTNKLGHVTRYSYDEMNNLVSVTDSMGNASFYEYDTQGRKILSLDKNNNETRYFYDDLNRLIETINSKGFSYRYCYDANGNTISETNYNNEVTAYEYDAFNRIVKRVDASGNETIYEYDNNYNRTNIIDANGNSTGYSYDALNRLTEVKDAEGNITKYKYDAVGSRTNIINAKGIAKRFYYDANKRLTKIKSPLGYETIYEYDGVGNRIKRINPDGHVTDYIYSALNQLTNINYDTGKDVTFVKDKLGRIVKYTSPEESGKMEYDELGRLIFWTNETINKAIRYSYDAMGNRKEMIDAEGDKTLYSYDENNNLKKILNYRESASIPQASMMSRSLSITGSKQEDEFDIEKYIADNWKDSKTNVVPKKSIPIPLMQSQAESSSIIITEDYTLTENMTFIGTGFIINGDNIVIDGNGHTITGDGTGRGISVNSRKNITIKNIKIDNFDSGIYCIYFDTMRIENVESINSRCGIFAGTYPNPNMWGGKYLTITNCRINNNTHGYFGDDIEYLKILNCEITGTANRGLLAAGPYTHHYLIENNIIKNNNSGIIHGYKPHHGIIKNNIIESNQIGIYAWNWDYNKVTLNTIKDNERGIFIDSHWSGNSDNNYFWKNNIYNNTTNMSLNPEVNPLTTYLDNSNTGNYWGRKCPDTLFEPGVDCNRPEVIDNYPYGSENAWLKGIQPGCDIVIIEFEYDPMGRIEKQINDNGTYSSYEYDEAGNLLSLIHQKDNLDIIEKFIYNYDKVGNRLDVTTLDGTTEYQYDKTYQLLRADYPDGEYEVFEYDDVGNRETYNRNGTNTKYTYDIEDRLLRAYSSQLTTDYEYDANGNQISVTIGKDSESFEYNEENLLSRYVGNGNIAEYKYSPFENRISKDVNGDVEYYTYEAPRMEADAIADYDNLLNIKTKYVMNPKGVDKPIVQKKNNGNYYYNKDGLGSVTSILDESAMIKNTYKYYAFGSSKAKTETIKNRYQYTSREKDNENNQYYYRSRMYNPLVGRFIQKDKYFNQIVLHLNNVRIKYGISGARLNTLNQLIVDMNDEERNLYWYANNNTILYNDSLGYANGCGTDSFQVPGNFILFDFTDACNDHDDCYETCGNSKLSCDGQFFLDLSAVCLPYIFTPNIWAACESFAVIYAGAVTGFGQDAYDAAQEHCNDCE